jgi:translation initiation factor 4B
VTVRASGAHSPSPRGSALAQEPGDLEWDRAWEIEEQEPAMVGTLNMWRREREIKDKVLTFSDRPRYDREEIPFPSKPPYTAHLGNLDYNVTSADIEEFLSDCSVTTVRIMEDKVDRKPKGFGYVEFGSPEGLRQALTKSESSFMGRNIKISVADPREY